MHNAKTETLIKTVAEADALGDELDALRAAYNAQTYGETDFRAAIKELQTDRANTQLFLDKMHEYESLRREERSYLSNLYRARAAALLEDQWLYDCVITNSDNRVKDYERLYRRFSFLHNQSLGRPLPVRYDLAQIKTIIPHAILGKPVFTGHEIYTWKCPFHAENTASFTWYKKANRGVCFGCNEKCDIIHLFMRVHQCTFVQACKELQTLV